jgi:hypothetical protein
LPEISDSKSAIYNNEPIIGRSFPLYTYSHSGDRSLNIQLHFFVVDVDDAVKNLGYLRIDSKCRLSSERAVALVLRSFRHPFVNLVLDIC